MPRLTTDIGPWSAVPLRLRIAFVILIGLATIAGLGIASGIASLPAVILASCLVGVVWMLIFDRRRPWWPDEPSLPVDPIGANARRSMAQVLVIAGVTVALVLADFVSI